MKDIPNFDNFVKVEPIHKGWSNDKKYSVAPCVRYFSV